MLETVTNELNLSPIFNYQIAIFRHGDKTHIFTTHIKNLSGLSLAYPEPLIFWALSRENFIPQKNFAVMVFGEELSYVCFFDEGGLRGIKNLPRLNLKALALRENREEFFGEILGSKGHVLEFLKLHKSEIFLTFNDVFDFGGFFEGKFCPHLRLEDVLREDKALQKLCFLSLKHLNNEANFIKKSWELGPIVGGIILFLVCFLGTLGGLFLKDYPQYVQNQITQQNNENLRTDLKKLSEDVLILEENLKELNRTHKNNTLLLGQNEEILRDLVAHFKPSKEESRRLWSVFDFLEQNALKISFFELKNQQIELVFNTETDHKKALEGLEKRKNLKLLNAEGKNLKLEFDDG